MRKALMYVLCFVLMLTAASAASAATTKVTARWSESTVTVNGTYVQIIGYNINGSNYFKLRDVVASLSGTTGEFDVTWNERENAIEIKKGLAYSGKITDDYYYYNSVQNAVASLSKIIVDGQLQTAQIYFINNVNYFQLRDLGKLVGFDVRFISEQGNSSIQITSPIPINASIVKATEQLIDNKSTLYFPRWIDTVNSYLYMNNDQTITTLEASDKIKISTYDENYKLLSSSTINYELPIFGAFYSGVNYNYIAFGQLNTDENNSKEVIRIVKYDKQFNKISSASLQGGASYTVIPFDAAAGRIAEHDDTLVFHTSRERYQTPDGLNHQSQLTIIVDTTTMKIVNDTGEFQSNHVSHSFDQYVLFDGNEHILLDHGDAFPRSISIQKVMESITKVEIL